MREETPRNPLKRGHGYEKGFYSYFGGGSGAGLHGLRRQQERCGQGPLGADQGKGLYRALHGAVFRAL